MLKRLQNNNQSERAISYQALWGSGGTLGGTTEAGISVNEDSAFKVAGAYACILLITDTIATLPRDAFVRRDGARFPYRPKPSWVDQPDVELLAAEHWQQILVSLVVDGNSFTRIFRDATGNVVNLVALNPQQVTVRRNERTHKIEYVLNSDEKNVLTQQEVLHITEIRKAGDLRGISRLTVLADNFGLAEALQNFASRFFAQGSITSGVIETPATMNREQAKDLADGFSSAHAGTRKSHKIGVLTGGAKFNRTSVNPDEAQMLESQRFAVEQIARIFRVPPHMIGLTTSGAMSYNSVEQQNINFVTHTLRPYIQKIEDAYSRLLPQQAFLRFNVEGLLRGDFQTRMQGYSVGINSGFLSLNDVRKYEDLVPVNGGDTYRVSLANVDLAAASLVEQDKRVAMAQKLILVGFDPASVLSALGMQQMQHTGVPTAQLQNVAQIDPENPESVYGV